MSPFLLFLCWQCNISYYSLSYGWSRFPFWMTSRKKLSRFRMGFSPFNTDNCRRMLLRCSLHPSSNSYSFLAHIASLSASYKYVDVTLASGLAWGNHTRKIAEKVIFTIGFINRNLKLPPPFANPFTYAVCDSTVLNCHMPCSFETLSRRTSRTLWNPSERDSLVHYLWLWIYIKHPKYNGITWHKDRSEVFVVFAFSTFCS